MRPKFKRFVAALMGVATLVSPVTALADDGLCSTYTQVESDSTGGDYVGGLLIYETDAGVTRSTPTTSTTVSSTTTSSLGVPGSSVGTTTTISTTTTNQGTILTAEEPVGYYAMNDGSVYQINCITGEENQIKSPTK